MAAGGSHAVFGTQSSEFGAGGSGSGTLELPATQRVGVQASAGALVLSKGSAPSDPTLATTTTGAAFLGTVGARVRAFGAARVAGPWIDVNAGIAQTGERTRPAFEAHIGYDVRVSRASRIDVGPYAGYTQIFQPESALRTEDARIVSIGLALSLGMRQTSANAQPVTPEHTPPPAPLPMPEPIVEQKEEEPEPPAVVAVDDETPEVRLFENRIHLDDIIHFEFDSARIRMVSHPLVRKVATFINNHPELLDIAIEGHADEIGTPDYNQKLSEDRAHNMRAMLVHYGVDAARLRVIGRGKSQPKIETNRSEYLNRRVELVVTRQVFAVNTHAASAERNVQ